MAKRRPQGEGTIRKRPDGRWEGRIIIGHKKDGTRIYKSVFGNTQKSTLKQLHQLIDLYRDVDLTEECRMTLGEWLDKWLDEYMIFSVRESTLNIYSHVTDTMRTQASVKIDRKIGGTNAEMPNAPMSAAEQFEPYVPKIRKSGTGCLYQVNENLWEGSFYPKMPNGKRKKFNVYAKTKEECEQALAEMIAEKKAEIANEKAKMA